MDHIAKRHTAASSPTIPLLLPIKPTPIADLPPLQGRLYPDRVKQETTSDSTRSPIIPGLELYSHLVKPSRVSAETRQWVSEKKEIGRHHDSIHSIPNQKAGAAAISAMTMNARNRRIAIEELRENNPTSELLPPQTVFVAHDLHRIVADMLDDDSGVPTSSTDRLDRLLDLLNVDPRCDAIVRPDTIPVSAQIRRDGQDPLSIDFLPAIGSKPSTSRKLAVASLLAKLPEPFYPKIDVKKLHKKVKIAAAQAMINESRAINGPRRQSQSASGTSTPGRLPSGPSRGLSTTSTRRITLSISTLDSTSSSSSSSSRRTSDSSTNSAPLSSFSLSADSADSAEMSIGTSASSVFLPTPTSGRSRSPSRDPDPSPGQAFATSDERRGVLPPIQAWDEAKTGTSNTIVGGKKRRDPSADETRVAKRRR